MQIQYEESIFWDLYDDTVRQLVETELEKLPPHEREAIWLQTREAEYWECKDESEREPYPVFSDDIVQYLVKEHIYHEAGRWSNQRIRAYLDRAS